MGSHQIQPGMPVYGADDQLLGTVSGIHGDQTIGTIEIDCDGEQCRVPITAIDRVTSDRLYLPNPAAQYRTQPQARAARAERADSAEAMPLPPGVEDVPAGNPLDDVR